MVNRWLPFVVSVCGFPRPHRGAAKGAAARCSALSSTRPTMFERGETSGRKVPMPLSLLSRAMPLSLLSKGNRLFIPPTQSASYYLPRAPIWGSGPDSMSVGVVHGLAVSVLCPPCSQAHCSQDPCSRVPCSAPFAAVAATSASVRTIGSKRSSIVCFVALAAIPSSLFSTLYGCSRSHAVARSR